MLFNSAEYALFLPIVFFAYVVSGLISLRAQNIVLIVAGYVFYGWWDWRFLSLIVLTSIIDFAAGYGMDVTPDGKARRWMMFSSLAANLGILGFFKYYNFFISSFVDAFAGIGISVNVPSLNVILPIGISFYTFQSLTYTIDIYQRKLRATRDPVVFMAYVAFFPQLLAGPIERAVHMLPQFSNPRHITPQGFASGLRQITWGLFCKLVVADNCAVIVNRIFEQPAPIQGSLIFVAAFFFAFQIYGDFSGYSHIACGSARLLGFELMQNFATPYFSQSMPEFWRRWHISLSSWFRDYVYIPLGGNRGTRLRQAGNILTTFTVSGLWHGASWTFVIWGFLNGLFCLPRLFIGEPLGRFVASGRWPVRLATVTFRMGITFLLTLVAWIFFRAKTVGQAYDAIASLVSPTLLTDPTASLRALGLLSTTLYAGLGVASLLALEWVQRDKAYALDIETRPATLRWAAYAAMVGMIVTLRYTGQTLDFIYFQF
ncbi:MBOAT family O-acyltransferase [Methyloterricola oryzae]|uniref:MBOAT family O-acyltransferase n=1 Tax=Methyloterricola oryzae TaxID=1495050 RepID=UPI0005EB82FE|nr:MBOAT family O-acyltransferase [Methyloterricola oryzae]